MVEQQELRAQECIGVWGFGHSRQGGGSGGTGSAQLASLVQGMQTVGDGQARFSLMAALIDQADAKPTSRGGGAFNVGEPNVRNARYGLRGVLVGEASNPGPPQTRNRPCVEVAEDIIMI